MAKRVLVVDDEPDLLMLIGLALEKNGFEVTTASDGKEGLDKAKTQRPDLIVLDVLMPKVFGNDMASLLREDPDTMNIPVIFLTNVPLRFLTGKKEMEEKMQRDNRGNIFLPKTCTDDELIAAINEILQNQPLD